MKKRTHNFFAAILFIFSTGILFPFSASAQKKDKMPVTISVMSYNIRMGTANDGTNSWTYRYPASALMIDDQHPDVFGVQEAFDFQLKYLAGCFDGRGGNKSYKYVGVGRDDGKKKGETMAIFYNTRKIKLIKWGTYWLSETPDKPSKGWDAACRRTATWALLKEKKSGKLFYFVNTHLDHVGKEARKNGLALVLDRIAEMNPESYPMVLTGDFNVTYDDPCLVELDRRMQSARKYALCTDSKPSYNGWGKKYLQIDYIYSSGFTKCLEFRTIDKPYMERKFISDHYPVSALLEF